MPSETQTLALMQEALKVIFGKTLHDDIVRESELLDIFRVENQIQTEVTTGGRYVEQGHFWQLPGGVGWRADDDYIPEAIAAKFKNSRVYLRKFLGTIQMSGDTMRRVRTDEGAFLDYMERARPALVERGTSELDWAYIGYGSGIKARVNSKTDNGDGTMTIVLKDHSGVAGYTDAWLAFLEGERVVFSANANFNPLRNAGADQSGLVVDVNEDNNSIRVQATAALIAAVAVNDYIGSGDGAGHSGPTSAGEQRALAGLLAAVDDGGILANYNGIDRTAPGNRLWRSVVINGGAAPFDGVLSEDLLNYAIRQARLRGGAKLDLFVLSESAKDSYWKSLKSDRFFVDPRGNYTGGKAQVNLVIGDRTYPFRVARKLPPQVAFGLQLDRLYRLTLGQLEWQDETGSIWNRVVDSTGRKDAYYAVYHMYEQLYCVAPRKQVRIDSLAPVF
ncbi:MAG: phage major capsid protein [candidate division KSB1 bacterium]|nr:phage major capsid protein [candidate division KSB1 bacterium]